MSKEVTEVVGRLTDPADTVYARKYSDNDHLPLSGEVEEKPEIEPIEVVAYYTDLLKEFSHSLTDIATNTNTILAHIILDGKVPNLLAGTPEERNQLHINTLSRIQDGIWAIVARIKEEVTPHGSV